jgi:hypothetical protein
MGSPANQVVRDDASTPILRNDDLILELDRAEVLIEELKTAKIRAEEIAQGWEQKYNEREKRLAEMISEKWGLEYEKKDRIRDIEMLESQLRNSIPLDDWRDPPPKLRTALEVGQQERIKALQDENTSLWKENRRLKGDKSEE